MNKKFEREVLKLRPDFGVVDGYFYLRPVGHILCGFVHERGSGGSYLWRYAFPLYDHVAFLSLAFGDRLPTPQGFMEDGDRPAKDQAAEFLRRVAQYEAATLEWQQMDHFLARVEASGLENPWLRRACAVTLIMLGRLREAEAHVNTLLASTDTANYPHFDDDIRRIAAELSGGAERAQQFLLRWEQQTKERFALR